MTGFPESRSTTAAPPRCTPSVGNDTYPPHPWPGCGKGSRATVPVFTCFRSTRAAPSYTPVTPTGTPQHLPCRQAHVPGRDANRAVVNQKSPTARHTPTPIRQIPGRLHLTRPQPLVPCVCLLVLLAARTAHLAVLDRRGFVRAACHQTRSFPTGPAALSFTQITAITRGSGSLTPIRNTRASRRTLI